MVREGRILISVATDPDFGSNYSVTAYAVGAQATGTWGSVDAGKIPVEVGHGFEAGDWFIVLSELPATTMLREVSAVTSTSLTCNGVGVIDGDILINIEDDSVTVAGVPDYNGSNTDIFSDMAYSDGVANSTVLTDSEGRYRYYHQGISIWELVRTSTGVPLQLIQSAAEASVSGPSAGVTTNNAVALWDGTDGTTLKNSVVISNAGAITGVTTLTASGLITSSAGGLTIAGAITGATTIGASGLITGTGGATISGTSALGIITASGALTVQGASTLVGAVTLTGGVAGAMTATGNVTSGGHIRGAKATVALTSSIALVTTDRILLDITNTSGNNTSCTLTAPSSQDGQILILRIAAITTGTFTLIESTTASMTGSTGWPLPGAGDTIIFIASGSLWYELCRSDN